MTNFDSSRTELAEALQAVGRPGEAAEASLSLRGGLVVFGVEYKDPSDRITGRLWHLGELPDGSHIARVPWHRGAMLATYPVRPGEEARGSAAWEDKDLQCAQCALWLEQQRAWGLFEFF